MVTISSERTISKRSMRFMPDQDRIRYLLSNDNKTPYIYIYFWFKDGIAQLSLKRKFCDTANESTTFRHENIRL